MVVTAAKAANPTFAASCCYCYHQTRRPTRSFVVDSQFPTKSLISQLGSLPSSWNGLKLLPISATSFYGLKEKKRKLSGKGACASLFGVGAPEALVIGVVALLVFGPKGLAEVARNLGKTLRAFQPTIRELQDVSREFKSTLEREIGLDEVSSSTNNTYKPTTFSNESQQATVDPNGTSKAAVYTSADFLKTRLEQLNSSATGSPIQESIPQEQQQDGTTAESAAYASEDLLKITQEQLAASATESQTEESIVPQEQQRDVATGTPSEVTTSSSPEAAAQIQPSEKEHEEK